MIPNAVQYNFDLLMMSTWRSKHVEAYNKLVIKPTGVMIPDAVQYNFDLLMMSTWRSKQVEAYNKLIIKKDFVHQVG